MLSECVVGIDDRVFEPAHCKQLRLGLAVCVHRTVVIEMITGEIGVHGDVVFDIRDATLIEPVTGDLHRASHRALSHVIAQVALQCDGVGGGGFRGHKMSHHAVANRAEHRRFFACPLKALRNPLCDRGFAIGAGHTRHPQRIGWAAINLSCDLTGMGFQIGHRHTGYFPVPVPDKVFRVVNDGGNAAGDRIGNKIPAVARRAAISKKSRPASGFATAGRHIVNLCRQGSKRICQLHRREV